MQISKTSSILFVIFIGVCLAEEKTRCVKDYETQRWILCPTQSSRCGWLKFFRGECDFFICFPISWFGCRLAPIMRPDPYYPAEPYYSSEIPTETDSWTETTTIDASWFSPFPETSANLSSDELLGTEPDDMWSTEQPTETNEDSQNSTTTMQSENPSDQTCSSEDSNGNRLPNPEDCGSFFQCSHGESVKLECPEGMHFNENLQVCDWPERAGCENE